MSKALMEKIVTASARETFGRTTDVNATRYGNVLCSRGSVVPLFVNQIQMGIPLTITDPHMTRFVMSIDEALLGDVCIYKWKIWRSICTKVGGLYDW